MPRGTPIELARLRRTVEPSRVRPTPRAKVPLQGPPEDAHPRVKAIWEEITAAMPDGVLSQADAPLFETYCSLAAIREELSEKLLRNGKASVERAKTLSQMAAMVRLQATLSNVLLISPAARTRVTLPAPAPASRNDEWKDVAR